MSSFINEIGEGWNVLCIDNCFGERTYGYRVMKDGEMCGGIFRSEEEAIKYVVEEKKKEPKEKDWDFAQDEKIALGDVLPTNKYNHIKHIVDNINTPPYKLAHKWPELHIHDSVKDGIKNINILIKYFSEKIEILEECKKSLEGKNGKA